MRNSALFLRASFDQEFGYDPDAIDPADIDEDFGDVKVEEVVAEDPSSETDEALPKTKVKNPNLSRRLPREDFAICIEVDDREPLMVRCKDILGDRMHEKRGRGYFLDGKPCNTDQIVAAAGLKYKDEEESVPSALPRKRKRKAKQ